MANFSIELAGTIYFLYRPKVEHQTAQNLEDVQRLTLVLKPDNAEQYVKISIGKKRLPQNQETYFSLVDTVTNNLDSLLSLLKSETYTTATRGQQKLPGMRCIGEGKFLLIQHQGHTHFIYQLSKPQKIGPVQEAFNLRLKDDFIVAIKNPSKASPPHAGLPPQQKANFSQKLAEKFDDYSFIPLIPADFLYYEGEEIIWLAKQAKYLEAQEISQCLEAIQEQEIVVKLKKTVDAKSIAPLIDKQWV